MSEHPDNRAAVEALRRVWNAGVVRDVPEFDPDRALWRRIAAGMAVSTKPRLVPTTPASVRSIRPSFMRRRGWVASIAALVAAGLVFSVALHQKRLRDRRAPVATRARAGVDSVPASEYATARGQVATIRLADGTKILLAPETKLHVPASVNETPDSSRMSAPRAVTLEGEAYFEVVHDARRPFTVRTAVGVVRDVGTEFNVRAYDPARGMKVSVVSGTVMLQKITAPANADTTTQLPAVMEAATITTLKRSDQATLLPTGAMTLAHGVDMRSTVAWTKGRLVFEGAPLRDVVIELSRWYDLDVRLSDSSIAERHLALELRDQPAAAVLNLVALSLNLRVERKEHVIILHPAK